MRSLSELYIEIKGKVGDSVNRSLDVVRKKLDQTTNSAKKTESRVDRLNSRLGKLSEGAEGLASRLTAMVGLTAAVGLGFFKFGQAARQAFDRATTSGDEFATRFLAKLDGDVETRLASIRSQISEIDKTLNENTDLGVRLQTGRSRANNLEERRQLQENADQLQKGLDRQQELARQRKLDLDIKAEEETLRRIGIASAKSFDERRALETAVAKETRDTRLAAINEEIRAEESKEEKASKAILDRLKEQSRLIRKQTEIEIEGIESRAEAERQAEADLARERESARQKEFAIIREFYRDLAQQQKRDAIELRAEIQNAFSQLRGSEATTSNQLIQEFRNLAQDIKNAAPGAL